ncbi:MAG TPA: NAD-dependent epimerase/dehydratase family protein, partial [Mycobacteriales bacterium]|nr:NAD-dependent epimerase/dehydratase family protein [Mycobacteriales bacterium]
LPATATALRTDLLDDLAADAVRDADVVFHLAARPGVREHGAEVEQARRRDNVLATAAVLAATPLTTPLVVTSSSSVYGGTLGRPCHEDDVLAPRGGYAMSKAAVEQQCAARLASGGAIAVARPFTVAGEGQRADMAIAMWLDAVRRGEPVELLGGPLRSRDITDVRDVVRCLIELADLGLGRTVNVGTGVGHTLADVLDAVCVAVGRPAEVVCSPAADVEVAATLADTTRCERLLGWRPTTDLVDLVRRQAAVSGARAVPSDDSVAVTG